MTQNKAKIGRPTSHIDKAALRALREESGFSLLALARKVYERAGKGTTSDAVMKNTAGRWESNGTVPLDMVRHLAEALNTTISVLRGAPPDPAPSWIDALEKHFHAQIPIGQSPELAAALEDCAMAEDEEAPARQLAESVVCRLEAAQLSQDQNELAKLAALTGYSVSELNRPTSYQGFWMFIGTGVPGPEKSEVLSGIRSVLDEVRIELQEVLDCQHESDAHVLFKKEQHWFQVTIQHARISQWTRTLRFARCQPNERGLQWVMPTRHDHFWLEKLPHEAYGHANFVTRFDGVQVPAECINLRFAISQNPSADDFQKLGGDARSKIVALCASHLTEEYPDRIEAFRRLGCSHHLIVGWLAANLWEEVQPWLSEWPLECWTFSLCQSRIDVCLGVPYRLWTHSKVPPNMGSRMSVSLVEQSAGDVIKRAPWRQKDVASVFEKLEKCRQETLQTQAQSPPKSPAA